MNRIVFIYSLLIICRFLFSSFEIEQDVTETIKVYTSGKNTDNRIKIVEGAYGIDRIYFQRKRKTQWIKAEILSIDTIQEYVKVKLVGTNEVFELFIDWNTHKMTIADAHEQKVIYWLEKS